MTTSVEIPVLPKQHQFLTAQSREVLYSGAFGAGKSRAVCLKAAIRASVTGSREGLCRKHLVTLKATTLRTLLEPDGKIPPVLPPGTYSHNKSEKIIRLRGGGEIVYFGLDDPDKIGSYNLSGCGVDEAVELTESDWRQLRGRIRLDVDNLTRQIYGACNPGPPSHHLAQRFGLALGHAPESNCEAIETCSRDNWFLPEDYLADLESFVGLAKARYVDGRWVGSEGLVYDRWDRSLFVTDRKGPWDRIIVGQDEGYTNPAVMLLIGLDSDGRMHVIDEFYKARQLQPAVIEQAQTWQAEHDIEAFIVDPSAAELRAAMAASGLTVRPANNDVFAGIQSVQQRLRVEDDGKPRLTVSPKCEQLIREFETYEWKPGKDEPIKQHDHAMDALRYGVTSIDGVGVTPLQVRVIGGRQEAQWTNERMWS